MGRRLGEPSYRTRRARAPIRIGRVDWQREVDALEQARERGEIDEDRWFSEMAGIFEAAYLAERNPRAQSGFGGDEERWEVARRPIAEAVDRDGSFLDIGCANGYLLECIARWSPYRVDPYGLEIAPRLAALARRRLPQWRERIFVGNALTWQPPRRFDFVRTELVYVPEARRTSYVERLLECVVAPGGRLIVCGYGSPRSGVAAQPVPAILRSYGFEPELEREVEAPEGGGPIIVTACLRVPAA